ncbi:MAG: hypothetical protein M0Z94_00235, partial [Dehalococcoidales bacterium]|nr:hypothetical protein [Dehalococcoidales bacterium]
MMRLRFLVLLFVLALLASAGRVWLLRPTPAVGPVAVTSVEQVHYRDNLAPAGRATFLVNGKPFLPVGV